MTEVMSRTHYRACEVMRFRDMNVQCFWTELFCRNMITACEVINPTKELGHKTLYEFNNRIIIYLYKIINFIK